MTATIVICAVTFLGLMASVLFCPNIKIGKIKIGLYWSIALTGAVVLIVFGLVPIDRVYNEITAGNSIDPLKILILFFSMTLLSVFLDETGFFAFLAYKASTVAKSGQYALFCAFYFLTAILTLFTSNDIVVLTFTPFICLFCKNAKIDPIPYLVGEFAAANTWSMALIIGNPTNVYLATTAGIDFIGYLKVMALPTLLSGAVEFAIVSLLFFKKFKKPIQPQKGDFPIKNKANLIIGIVHLSVCLVFLATSGFIGADMWLIAALCALSLVLCALLTGLITKKFDCVYRSFLRLPWQLVPFVLSMFAIVVCLEYQGVAAELGKLLGEKNAVITYGGASFIASNLINNIPMSILFGALPKATSSIYLNAVYATVIGSNIGAFLTPVGALAGIMFTSLTEKAGVKYGFKEFIKYGAIVSLPTLFTALFTLSLIL